MNDSTYALAHHSFGCALPTRGGICNCQPDDDPVRDPWPRASQEQRTESLDRPLPLTRAFGPGGRFRMFERIAAPADGLSMS